MYGSLWLINYKDKRDSSSTETSDVVKILHEIRLTYLIIIIIIIIIINIYIAQIPCEHDQMRIANKYDTNQT